MKIKFKYLLCLMVLLVPLQAIGGEYMAIAYHDVLPGSQVGADPFAISVTSFVEQMEYLRSHDYHPVRIDDIIADRKNRKPLPEKAVLLSFDDGLLSFYKYVLPVLKLYNYPAVLAIVSSWADEGFSVAVDVKNSNEKKIKVMNWKQINEVSKSPLVEVASHSDDLHQGVIYNPQGNVFAAGSSFIYQAKSNTYESDDDFRKRINKDLKLSKEKIEKHTGEPPRIIVWPYGQFNQLAQQEAALMGMGINFSVEDGITTTDSNSVNRGMILNHPSIEEFVSALRRNFIPEDPVRAIQIDLDMIYDVDKQVEENNLGKLLERLVTIGANVVFLQAFADPDGDGNASELYFANRVLPVRSDLFNRVAHQIKTRTEVEELYAWMPLLAFDLPDSKETEKLLVKNNDDNVEAGGYRRLSPFSETARKTIFAIYEDLAKHSNITGVLFQDDAYLTDFEDFHPDAKKEYQKRFGKPISVDELNRNAKLMQKWTSFKTSVLIDFTDEISQKVRYYRPNTTFARNIYAPLLTDPDSEEWFAQNYEIFLNRYDKVVVMAYPYMEEVKEPLMWLAKLAGVASRYKTGSEKTIFKLQAQNWKNGKWIPEDQLSRQIVQLVGKHARNIAYYPDNLYENKPNAAEIRKVFSLNASPFFQ